MLGKLPVATKLKFNEEDAFKRLKALRFSPYWFNEMLALIHFRSLSISHAFERVLEAEAEDADFAARWAGFDEVDKQIAVRVIAGGSPYSEETVQLLSEATGENITIPKIQNRVRQLMSNGIIAQVARGRYAVDDPLFALWVGRHLI